jgi:hypothetical protein
VSERFRWNLRILAAILWFQRTSRLILRAAWLAAAGYLLAWGTNELWGWLPDTKSWVRMAVGFGSLPLLAILGRRVRMTRLAWRLDQTYHLSEQITTAWQVSRGGSGGGLVELLAADATALLGRARRRILLRGWFWTRDVVSLLIVIVLLALVFGHDQTVTSVRLPTARPIALPPLGSDPVAAEVIPSGIPGMEPPPAPSSDGRPDEQGSDMSDEGQVQLERGSVAESALKDIGRFLSRQAATHDLGQSLENGDWEGAAREMEMLADQLDQLSDLTQGNLANAFEAASQAIERQPAGGPAAEQTLAEELQSTADSLRDESPVAAREKMGQLADGLRVFGQMMHSAAQAGGSQGAHPVAGGADAQEIGSSPSPGELRGLPGAEVVTGGQIPDGEGTGTGQAAALVSGRQHSGDHPLERLVGEGETLLLWAEEGPSGLLSPGQGEAGGPGRAGSDADRILAGDETVIDSVLAPYHYPRMWRDVVSAYFSIR